MPDISTVHSGAYSEQRDERLDVTYRVIASNDAGTSVQDLVVRWGVAGDAASGSKTLSYDAPTGVLVKVSAFSPNGNTARQIGIEWDDLNPPIVNIRASAKYVDTRLPFTISWTSVNTDLTWVQHSDGSVIFPFLNNGAYRTYIRPGEVQEFKVTGIKRVGTERYEVVDTVTVYGLPIGGR